MSQKQLEQVFALPNKTQRDIYWSLFGASMLSCDWSPVLDDWLPDLHIGLPELTQNNCQIDYSSQRLGFRFEQLWHHALTLAGIPFICNLQIQESGNTLGELDLLIHTPTETIHAELALKFYLGVEDDWIGPNRRDLLSRKLEHTINHQLPMGQAPATQACLSEKNIKISRSLSIMRGCLFHPIHEQKTAQLPVEVAPNHWRGIWCPVDLLTHYLPESAWYVLAKQDWISPIIAPFGIDKSEMIQYLTTHFRHFKSELCIARVELTNNGWEEQERWMIVAEDWGL